jgi:hypothetical protein
MQKFVSKTVVADKSTLENTKAAVELQNAIGSSPEFRYLKERETRSDISALI